MKTLESSRPSTNNSSEDASFNYQEIKCDFCLNHLDHTSIHTIVRIPSNVRSLKSKEYFVFKCPECQSIHSLAPVEYDKIYENYPLQKQKMDFFTRQLLKKRLRLLKNSGLKKEHTILDYGCGSGMFVQFLNELGYQAKGFDPYTKDFSNPLVLENNYDWVLNQDVIEHVEHPNDFLKLIQSYLNPKGTLVIGTPNAERINLLNKIDQIGPLHQPFHRHIYSERQIKRALSEAQLTCTAIHRDWYVDTLFPFINSAFLYRLFLSGDGTIERGFEPIHPWDFIKNPALLFWGFFGFFFSRKTDMLVFAKKDED